MLAQYHKDLRQWEEETERQKYEFTLTEKDLLQTTQLDKCTQVRTHTSLMLTSSPLNLIHHVKKKRIILLRKVQCLDRKLAQENIR